MIDAALSAILLSLYTPKKNFFPQLNQEMDE